MEWYYIEPGKPIQNGVVVSFIRLMWDECLSEHPFGNLGHANRLISTWRYDYNMCDNAPRLGGLTLWEYFNRPGKGHQTKNVPN